MLFNLILLDFQFIITLMVEIQFILKIFFALFQFYCDSFHHVKEYEKHLPRSKSRILKY